MSSDQARAFDPAALRGLPFAKMTGSGNDFVFFDGRAVDLGLVTSPEAIRAICSRTNGVGSDGLVVLEPRSGDIDVRIHYFNSDGSPADLCGNATLCSTALAAELALASAVGMRLETGAGLITSRVTASDAGVLPEIDFQPVTEVRDEVAEISLAPGERRVGFALAGIPHLVILCDDVDQVDVAGRGPGLRRHPATGPAGANVNWVSGQAGGPWRYRTFERGVEGETLACGTGAVATACLLSRWQCDPSAIVTLMTTSGREVRVTLRREDGQYRPSLRGEGRVVFRGQLESLR